MQRDYKFADLVEIMDRLRSEDGCPWDREQDLGTLRGYLLEECYEVVEAIDRLDYEGIREELGDLMFQIVFQARIGKERGRFTINDVIQGIAEKMVRRHPHVFGDWQADSSEQVLKRWEEIKREEKNGARIERSGGSVLSGIPSALPALLKAYRLGTKAARVGFDWVEDKDVLSKIDEEYREMRLALAAGDETAVSEEIGDMLFTLVMLARRHRIDPEAALERANRKFTRRFREVEAELERRNIPLDEADLATMDSIWNEVKKERNGG